MKRYDRHGLYNVIEDKWYATGNRTWHHEIVIVGNGNFRDCLGQYRHIYNTQRLSLYQQGRRYDNLELKSVRKNLWVVHIDCFHDVTGVYHQPDFSQSVRLEEFVGDS